MPISKRRSDRRSSHSCLLASGEPNFTLRVHSSMCDPHVWVRSRKRNVKGDDSNLSRRLSQAREPRRWAALVPTRAGRTPSGHRAVGHDATLVVARAAGTRRALAFAVAVARALAGRCNFELTRAATRALAREVRRLAEHDSVPIAAQSAATSAETSHEPLALRLDRAWVRLDVALRRSLRGDLEVRLALRLLELDRQAPRHVRRDLLLDP
jgi:hypothetical protein